MATLSSQSPEPIKETKINNKTRPRSHIAENPVFIFQNQSIPWNCLTPYLVDIYGNHVEKKIIGTFPVPHDYNGTETSNIKYDRQYIYFPTPGDFYLHTTVGFFKILIIDPTSSHLDKVLSISSFIAGNTVHSLADARQIAPEYNGTIFPQKLLPILFASDQPLKLHCGYISEFLAYILIQQGYRVHKIQLKSASKAGHIITEVFIPELNKFIMIDPDYGTMVKDDNGRFISIAEVGNIIHKTHRSPTIIDISKGKTWLDPIYNNPEPMPSFSWTPRKSSNILTAKKARYQRILSEYSHEYAIYDRTPSGRWELQNKFLWDAREQSYIPNKSNPQCAD